MNNAPKQLKDKWSTQTNKVCARRDEGNCQGRLTKEHVIIYAGKQLQEDWAILDICEYHHAVNTYQDSGDLNKEKHEWLALNRATPAQLQVISKLINYEEKRKYLNKKYGEPNRK